MSVYNPSLIKLNVSAIAVPDGHFRVETFNTETKSFEAANASVLCDYDEKAFQDGGDNCWLYVDYPLPGHSFGFILLYRNFTFDLKADVLTDPLHMRITSDLQNLRYKRFDANHGAMFTLEKQLYLQSYHLSLDLRYYPAYQGYSGTRSGAAIFRPATAESKRYGSEPERVYKQQSGLVS